MPLVPFITTKLSSDKNDSFSRRLKSTRLRISRKGFGAEGMPACSVDVRLVRN